MVVLYSITLGTSPSPMEDDNVNRSWIPIPSVEIWIKRLCRGAGFPTLHPVQ